MEKVAKLLLEKEVINRLVLVRPPWFIAYFFIHSEDMIRLLGKRPFTGKSDDMDKWLDENGTAPSSGGAAVPPEVILPPSDAGPLPAPVASSSSPPL